MTALVEEHTARQRRFHARIQEEHGALAASLGAAGSCAQPTPPAFAANKYVDK